MSVSALRTRSLWLAVLLAAVSVSQMAAARQQGVLNGVVVETRTDQDKKRTVLLQIQGSGTQTFDQISLELPRGLVAADTQIVPPANGRAWPAKWQCRVNGRMLILSGPPIDHTAGLFRIDLGTVGPPKTLNVNITLNGRRLFSRDEVVVTELPPLTLSNYLADFLVVPDLVNPGRDLTVGLRNPERTPPSGTWTLQWQPTPNGSMVNLPFKLADPTGRQLVLQLPAEQSIVDDILAGAVKGGFGAGQGQAAAARPDHLTDADWAALKSDEARIQALLVNEFTRVSQGTAAAVTDYLHHMDAYRTAFQRITSSSTGLQAKLAEWEKVHGAAQTADLALAVVQLGYGGIKGGTALFRWLTRPQTIAEATQAGVRAGAAIGGQADNATGAVRAAAGAAEAAPAARPVIGGARALEEQINVAQRGAIQQMAAQAGIDANAWIKRFSTLEEAYVALVNQTAASQGLVSLATPAQRLLERLVVAGTNARAGRAGAATAQEIAQLRQWASQPGFWDKLAKAAQWFEEPGRLIAGGQEMFQPASQFALTFSAEEIAVLRALAQSDDAARLASQLGAAADSAPTFIERLPQLDATTMINPGRAPVIPPTINRLPALDTPTLLNPGRSPAIPSTLLNRPGAVLDAPTLIDRFVPAAANVPIRIGQQAGGALQVLPALPSSGPFGTVRLTESAIQGAAGDWGTLMNLRTAGALAPAIATPMSASAMSGLLSNTGGPPPGGQEIFAALGGVKGTLHAGFVDRWGDQVLRASQPISFMPALRPNLQPRLFDVTPIAFPGDQFCVCGLFPGNSASGLRLNGSPIVAVTSSESVTCLQVPQATTAGSHVISGDPAAGFDPSNTVTIGILTLSGELDQAKLLRGESTPLRLWISGTSDAKPIRLRNTTPSIISMTGGDDQVVMTSGGATNEWRGTVTGIYPGPFQIMFSIDGPSCPCALNTGQWSSFVGSAGGLVPTGPGLPAAPPTVPVTTAGPYPIDFNFRIDPMTVLNVQPAAPLFQSVTGASDVFLHPFTVNQMMNHTATQNGWHELAPSIAQSVDRLLSVGLEAVVKGGTIPAADLQTLQELSKVEGFWNWLAASQSAGTLPLSLRYSAQDIEFLQALAQAGGDVAKLRNTLGPIRVAALGSLVAQQAASADRARAFATAVNVTVGSDAAVQAVDYDTLMRTLWGNNEVYSAMKYYGLVSGSDPGLGHFGWMLADYAYGWLSSPIETASRTRATLEAQTAYEEFLATAGGDLTTLGRAANDALAALDRLSVTFTTARLADPASALGGRAASDLQAVLDRMQGAFDQATPTWKAAHADEMAAIRSHIDQKLADLAAATGFLKEMAGTLPQMMAWLRSVVRDAPGGVKAGTAMFNPEIFVRLGAIALYLENMTAAGLLIADDPVGASTVRGPRTAERRPMTLDTLRAR